MYDDSNIGMLVILVNSVYLIASSFLIIVVALSYNGLIIVLTACVSVLFLASQYQELALANCLLAALHQSALVLLIQIHGSHRLLEPSSYLSSSQSILSAATMIVHSSSSSSTGT